MQKFKEFIYRFMYGRYGADEFSKFTLIFGGVLFVLYMLTGLEILYIFFMATVIYNCFRMFSRNTYKRQQELQAFYILKNTFNSKTAIYKRMWRERKTHRFFACPVCKTVVRVPKGRGKIEISCPKCNNKFIKKT